MNDRERQERLRQHGVDINAGLRVLYEGPQSLLDSKAILDAQIRELRGQIADQMWEEMLRLGLGTVNELNPVTDKTAIARLIREGLLGHMEDETPTSRIIPIGSRTDGEAKPQDDPLYRHIFPKLTLAGKLYTIGTLIALGRLVRPGFLDTLSGVRKVEPAQWNLFYGFGNSRGIFMHEAVKKIDIPRE